jgi:hypothetical protein
MRMRGKQNKKEEDNNGVGMNWKWRIGRKSKIEI